ncbi:MAG: putative Ig domain-containing protein, partial [Oligoflexus sp.]
MIARLFFQRRVMSSFVFTISCLTLAACGGKGGGPGPDQGTHDETIIQPEDEETDVSTAPEEEEEIVPKYFNLTSYGISSSYPSIITMAVGVTNRITGLPVTNLEITNERSDFQVLEDDKPITERESFLDLEPIESISNQLDTVLMIDVSSSLTRADLINVQKAAIGLVSNLAINQRVAIYVFDDTVRQVIDFSTDVSALTNAINNITLGGPSTNLFGAIMHGYSLWSNSFSFNQITYGALILLTDGNDTSGLATLSEAITAKGNRDFFAITVGNEINQDVLVQLVLGKEQTVTDADRNRAAGRLISAADYSKVDAALQQIAEEVTRLTKGVYFLYYATPTRAGMHTVSVSVKDNPPCEATELFCVDRLNGEFNADGFSSVTPELVVKRPDEWLQADQSYELKARVRWANPPFTLNWPFDSLDGQIKLDIDKVDKSKATLSVAKDTLLDLASLTVSVLEYPSLTRTFPFRVGVPIRDEEGILRPSNTILLSNARLSIELAAAIDCNECSWELSNPSVATLSTQTGQDIILQRGSTPGITNLIISEPTGARSTSYPIQTTFFTQVADQIYMTDVGITTLTISYGRFLENCEVSPELPPGLAINVVDNTCLITGTPSAARKATRYTITVTTTNDTQDTVSMMITVNVPQPPKLANATNQTYVATVPISPLNFVNTGEPAMSCTISPALPEGLILSSTIGTCQISGAPMAAQAEATYTITSIAADGSQDTATVTITVIEANPPIFTNVADLILEMDQAASLSFNNAGGAVVTCEISPSLPIGLIIASTGNTCQITGTPSVIKVGAAYTLTATATDGSQNAMTFNILFPRFWSIPQNTVGYSSIGSNQVNDVDVSGSNIYLATNGGLSISEDEGETWVTKTTSHGLGHNIVNGVYTSGSVLYAATLGGLSISYNGGASWATKNVNHGLGRNNVLGVYASESNIYAATQGGLSISSD